jgi:hypothetical protein
MELKWMRGEYSYYESDSGIDIDADIEGYAAKGFAANTWNINRYLSSEVGARMLYHTEGEFLDLGPTVAFSITPLPELSFRLAWGQYFQPVNPLHLPVEAGVDSTLESERSTHWVGGGQYNNINKRLNLRLEAYYKQYDRLAGYIRDFGRKSKVYWPSDKGYTWGVEGIVDKGFGPLLAHLGYTYSISRVEYRDTLYYSDNDRRHAVDAGLSFEPGKKWSMYLGFNFHTGEPYTEYVQYQDTLRVGERNGARLPAYHSLSTRISRHWQWKRMQMQAYLQVMNLYNQANVHEYTYTESQEGGNTVYTRNEEYLLPILPSFGINVSF